VKPCLFLSLGAVLCFFSCALPDPHAAPPGVVEERAPPRPPQRSVPALQIRDYKNRENGAALAPWFRAYLEGGIDAAESLEPYRTSYLFVAVIRSPNLAVITQWVRNFSADQDFSRLAAERIRARMERDLTVSPDTFYGPQYNRILRTIYRTVFWGARKENDSWIFGPTLEVKEKGGALDPPLYWGFILISIPKESLEIQVNKLLGDLKNVDEKTATRVQTEAFEDLRIHLFEGF
jgi:hypothetical protein